MSETKNESEKSEIRCSNVRFIKVETKLFCLQGLFSTETIKITVDYIYLTVKAKTIIVINIP